MRSGMPAPQGTGPASTSQSMRDEWELPCDGAKEPRMGTVVSGGRRDADRGHGGSCARVGRSGRGGSGIGRRATTGRGAGRRRSGGRVAIGTLPVGGKPVARRRRDGAAVRAARAGGWRRSSGRGGGGPRIGFHACQADNEEPIGLVRVVPGKGLDRPGEYDVPLRRQGQR